MNVSGFSVFFLAVWMCVRPCMYRCMGSVEVRSLCATSSLVFLYLARLASIRAWGSCCFCTPYTSATGIHLDPCLLMGMLRAWTQVLKLAHWALVPAEPSPEFLLVIFDLGDSVGSSCFMPWACLRRLGRHVLRADRLQRVTLCSFWSLKDHSVCGKRKHEAKGSVLAS